MQASERSYKEVGGAIWKWEGLYGSGRGYMEVGGAI